MWRDSAWLHDMVESGKVVLQHVQGVEWSQFVESELHQDSVIRRLMIVGEAAKRVSAEFRGEHPEIPWREISGFRDVLVHDYGRVDLKRVWDIIHGQLIEVIDLIEPLVPVSSEGDKGL